MPELVRFATQLLASMHRPPPWTDWFPVTLKLHSSGTFPVLVTSTQYVFDGLPETVVWSWSFPTIARWE